MNIKKIPDEVKLRLQGFIDFCHEYDPEPIATEISLYCTDVNEDGQLILPWAGTADNIMRITEKNKKGDEVTKLWLIDLKTGKEYKDHELQLTSYKMLWDHIHGEEHGKIDVLACLYLNSKGKYKVVKTKYVPYVWWNVYMNFEYMLKDKRGNMPKIKERKELPNLYSLKGDGKDD